MATPARPVHREATATPRDAGPSTQDASLFALGMIGHIRQMISVFNDLQNDQYRMQDDPGLAMAAAEALNNAGRQNLTDTTFNNAADAIGQILFAYTSGAPSQRSKLFALL